MKKSVYFALLLSLIGLQACTNSAKKTKDSDEARQSKNNSTAAINNEDAEFLMKAADGGMMEVELGKLAQANGSDSRVKNFGSMMVTDHGKANDQLKELAASKNVVLSATLGKDHQDKVDKLKKKKGQDFDLTYMNIMVKDHKADIKEFKDAAGDAADSDIKSFAVKALPVLQKHLDSAKSISKVLKPALGDNVIIP